MLVIFSNEIVEFIDRLKNNKIPRCKAPRNDSKCHPEQIRGILDWWYEAGDHAFEKTHGASSSKYIRIYPSFSSIKHMGFG